MKKVVMEMTLFMEITKLIIYMEKEVMTVYTEEMGKINY
jgi:hypothetical protein